MTTRRRHPPESCPNCGADVPRNARACPECGACEETGWSEEALADPLGLDEEAFDYDDFLKREFSASRQVVPRGIHWFWWLVAFLLVAGLLGYWLGVRAIR